MRRRLLAAPASSPPLLSGAGRSEGAARGFSMTELLVAVSIVLMLMTLLGGAVSAARTSGAKQKVRSTIAVIDAILQQHFTSAESSRAQASEPAADRGVVLRRQVTADMPDSWAEVAYMKQQNDATPEGQPKPFHSARQRGYVAFLDTVNPTNDFADAECLFMIVMQGGLADCLTCLALEKIKIGDKDEDGALEFWDEWDEPIRYVLWPGGFELPVGTRFFSAVPPFSGAVATGDSAGPMRPLLFSGGPSKLSSTEVHAGSYLSLDNACGDPANATISRLGGLPAGSADHRRDNITNFDTEAKR
jgi:prepilin-type N-terminal cleavage/methylation domain-containing protein